MEKSVDKVLGFGVWVLPFFFFFFFFVSALGTVDNGVRKRRGFWVKIYLISHKGSCIAHIKTAANQLLKIS